MRSGFCIPTVGALCAVSLLSQGRDVRMWNKPYVHEQTGIILPTDIAGYQLHSISDYADADYDGTNLSVRFEDEVTHVDVYFYRVAIPEEALLERDEAEDIAERYAIEIGEVKETQQFIRRMAGEGKMYHEVEISPDASIDEYGSSEEQKAMVSAVMRYRESKNEPDDDGFGQAKRESCVAISLVSESWIVKVRHTFVLTPEEVVNVERREKRRQLLGRIRKLISDPEVRGAVSEAIEKLKDDPADQEAGGTVAGYAEASALVQVNVSTQMLPFFQEDDFKGATELLASFIAGNVEAQWKNRAFFSHDREGVLRMLDAYARLKAEGACDPYPLLDEWNAARASDRFTLPKPKP